MRSVINPDFKKHSKAIHQIIIDFDKSGILFGDGDRNKIKLFDLDDKTINIKSFKIPAFINKIIYKYFRTSKAFRSYTFANMLLENGFCTPEPIAFFEEITFLGLNRSYYISEHLKFDFMFRHLVENPEEPENETILRQFVKFCFDLHEKGIEFLDHSPGNTLIKKNDSGIYDFYLVDLNRMKFHKSMTFECRMNNLRRLTTKTEMMSIISNEYSKFYNKSEQEIYEVLLLKTNKFQESYHRKRRWKKKYIFWKK